MIRHLFTLCLVLSAGSLFSQSQFFQRPLDPARMSPGNDVIPTGPDEYLLSSFFYPGGAIMNAGHLNLTRLRPAGEIVWSNDYTFPFPLVAGALESWPAYQSFLFAGLFYDAESLPSAMLSRVNQDGTLLWTKAFPLDTSILINNVGKVDVRGLPEGRALVGAGPLSFALNTGANDLSLMKVDPFGDLIWGKNYCFSCEADVDLTFGNVALTADSGYVVCGGVQYQDFPSGTNQDVFLMKVDTAGQLLWARSYNLPDTISPLYFESGFAATVLPNGHIAIVGDFNYEQTTTLVKDGLILEVDAMGVPVKALRVNLDASLHDVYLNHVVALDSHTLVIPGSSVQDTIPFAGVENNFLFQLNLNDETIGWSANYYSEIVAPLITPTNGFSPLPGGYAYLANFSEGIDTYYPNLIIADANGRTACQEPIGLVVKPVIAIETTDFTAQVKELTGAEDFDPVSVPFDEYDIDVPVLDLGPSELFCEPTTKLLDATVPGAESYVWSNGATSPQILAEVPGTYFVEDTSHVECWILRDTVSFNILPPPFVSIAADTTGFCEIGQVTLIASAVGAESLFWNTGATTATITVTQEGLYTVQAENMCGTTIESISLVLPDCDGPPMECRLEFPNAFTPDNDGSNDRFRPLSNCEVFGEYRLRIYSRWGELVYESTEPAQGWDGQYKENPMASDLYAWILEYRFPEEEETKLEKGEVTLVR